MKKEKLFRLVVWFPVKDDPDLADWSAKTNLVEKELEEFRHFFAGAGTMGGIRDMDWWGLTKSTAQEMKKRVKKLGIPKLRACIDDEADYAEDSDEIEGSIG